MAETVYKPRALLHDYTWLSQLFSSSFLYKLLHDNHKRSLFSILRQTGLEYSLPDKCLTTVLEDLYEILQRHYRCEYVYKSVIANKILLGRHSLNNSLLLTEFRAGNSNADVVIFNGTSSVYEIKTELDNLGRLSLQLEQYLKIFDKIYVVTYIENARKIVDVINPRVGILTLSNNRQLRTYRDATSNKKFTEPEFIFDSLRRIEYEEVIKKAYGFVPDVPNTMIYTVCKELFIKLSPAKAHDHAVNAILKLRQLSQEQKNLVMKAPNSLKLLFLSKEFSVKNCLKLEAILTSKI